MNKDNYCGLLRLRETKNTQIESVKILIITQLLYFLAQSHSGWQFDVLSRRGLSRRAGEVIMDRLQSAEIVTSHQLQQQDPDSAGGINKIIFQIKISLCVPEETQRDKVDDPGDNSDEDVEEGNVEGWEEVDFDVLRHAPDHQAVGSNVTQTPDQAPHGGTYIREY